MNWLNEILIKRRAQTTTVFIVESGDSFRFDELKQLLIQKEYRVPLIYDVRGFRILTENGEEELYLNPNDQEDPLGLQSYKEDYIIPPLKPIRKLEEIDSIIGQNKTRSRSISHRPQYSQYIDSRSAVRIIDSYIRRKTIPEELVDKVAALWVIFVLNNKDPFIEEHIRTWIRDRESYYLRHTIIFYTEKAVESIFEPETLRLAYVIKAPLATQNERRELLKKYIETFGIQVEEAEIEKAITTLAGLTLHESESAIIESIVRKEKIDPEFLLSYKYDIIRREKIISVVQPRISFKDVGGMSYLKDLFERRVINQLKNYEKVKQLGALTRGILLFGPPGTGKTYISEALAGELNVPLFKMNLGELLSKWYGESEQRLTRMLMLIESLAPAILYIDEFDAIASKRGTQQEHEASRRLKNILLEFLGKEERETILIASTNRPQDLDDAMLRRGRFSYLVPVLWPDKKSRYEILQVHINKVSNNIKPEEIKDIARKTAFWSSAELADLVREAIQLMLDENSERLLYKHIQETINDYLIEDLEERKEKFSEYIHLSIKFANRKSFIELLYKAYQEELEATTQKIDLKKLRGIAEI